MKNGFVWSMVRAPETKESGAIALYWPVQSEVFLDGIIYTRHEHSKVMPIEKCVIK